MANRFQRKHVAFFLHERNAVMTD